MVDGIYASWLHTPKKIIRAFLCFFVLFVLSFTAMADTRTLQVRKVYLRDISLYTEYGDGRVMFSVAEEPDDTTPNYSFYMSLTTGNGSVAVPEAKEFMALLLLAKINELPVRIQYETDAPAASPVRKDHWGTAERQPSMVTGIGIDN